MYYVIKRQKNISGSCFLGFSVPRYIASQKTDNVILEFLVKNKPIRKWIKKDDIVLLTDNQEYFKKILNRFQEVEKTQQKLVDEAKKHLDKTIQIYTDTINAELDKFEELKTSHDIPSLLD